MKENMRHGDRMDATAIRTGGITCGAMVQTHMRWEAYRQDGTLKWSDENHNMVMDEGLDELMRHQFGKSTISSYTTWKIGLVAGSSITPAGSWVYTGIGSSFTEATAYSGSRQTFTTGAVASQVISNTASKASFTITGSSTITVIGAFVAQGPNSGTKGNSAAGNRLYSVAEFTSGVKSLDPTDVLKVSISVTGADA